MTVMNERIRAALLNRDLTHSAFRMYVALEDALEGRTQERPVGISVARLKELMPGVRGKPFGEGPLREAIQNLLDAGLIRLVGPKWSKVSLHVELTGSQELPSGPLSEVRLAGQLGYDD